MHNGQKIGVGIVTCNRRESFKRLFMQVANTPYVDNIFVVKNKDFDYREDDPQSLLRLDNRAKYQHVPDDVGVGFCKNVCLKSLLDDGCDHLFLIEDDILIKDNSVFKEYIDTAKAFKLEHLNFNRAYDSITQIFLKPFFSVRVAEKNIDLFRRLCGDFQYFTRNSLESCGLFKVDGYKNALEHAEHTYRMSVLGFTTPFNVFADIAQSDKYLEDTGIVSSIHYDYESKKKNNEDIVAACKIFSMQYGTYMAQIKQPSVQQAIDFIKMKVGAR